MSNFNQSKQSVDSQFNADRIRDIHHNVVNNHIPSPVEAIKEAWSITSKWFRSMLPEVRRDYSSIVQFDAKHNKVMERIAHERLELAKIDSSRRADTENRLIQLKEEEKQLKEARFEWEKSVVQENLKLIQDSHTNALEMNRKKLQIETDKHYLNLEVSRDDIIRILSQEDGKFVIIPSPPKVFRGDVEAFKSLEAEIPPKLKRIIEKYYGGATRGIIGCKNIFKDPVGETNALVVGELLAPIPTLILRSQVTHQHVYIAITITCPVVKTVAPQTQNSEQQFTMQIHRDHFLLPEWNWMNLKKELEAQGQDCDTSSQVILDLISTIHSIVTLCFCDLYCLNLNPSHIPKLFEFLAEPNFPDSLRKWAEPLQSSLVEAQKQIEEELDRIRALETENLRQVRSESYTDFGDFSSAPIVASGIGLMFLLAMCSQQSPQMTGGNTGTQSSIEQSQSSQATSARIISRANLRSAPKKGNEFIIGEVRNGEQVMAYEVSPDGQWRRVKLSDGRSGWVASNFVK